MGEYLVADDLTRSYGGAAPAVDGLSFSVRRGELFALLGPNGAGKTTTIRLLTGLLGPSRGTAYVDGMDVRDAEKGPEIRRRIGLLPEAAGLYESLTVHRNLELYGRLFGLSGTDLEGRIRGQLTSLGLTDRADHRAGTLSKGLKQRLAIARALLHEPECVVLDEPITGLDPEAAKSVRDALVALRAQGRTILLSTHHLEDADRLSDRVAVIRGRLLAVDTPAGLKRRLFRRLVAIELSAADATAEQLAAGVAGVNSVHRDGPRLTLDLARGEEEVPEAVERLVRAGYRIRSVAAIEPSLEEAYLRLLEASPRTDSTGAGS
ncbi:MAG: ABC transporter ATP-binding protein [Thermoplasmata archaeon]|nr:ABC transporter ATP-binding protein [Thermoplasmata archaeon]